VTKHPELLEMDTLKIAVHDTIVLETVSHDTTTQLIFHDSTIIVNNKEVFAKYFYDTLTREFHHYIECKGDTVTIIKEVAVPVEKVVIKELTWWEKNSQWIYILLAVLGGSLIFQKLKKVFI
tara:strand:- start:1595 stop:1960 length:366 start_codon:yes stop_codon:yes gene_type:complete